MQSAVRVIMAIEPRMYREALAFSLREHRPEAEVSLVGSTDDLIAEVERTGAHLIVANEVPSAVREAAFWIEVSEVRPGESLGAEISADGYSRSVRDFHVKPAFEALDRAEEELVSETSPVTASQEESATSGPGTVRPDEGVR
jgi:hypothetical protein